MKIQKRKTIKKSNNKWIHCLFQKHWIEHCHIQWKTKNSFFFHELNQKIYIQLMYNIIFINFNILCDKIIQIESIKKKRSIKITNSKENWEKSKVFSNNIKHFRMIKTEIKIEIIFKIKTKKMITKTIKKKNITPENDPQSRRLRIRIWWKMDINKKFLKKRSNVIIIKNWNIMLTIILNLIINNKQTSENNKNIFFFLFQKKNNRI